MAEKGARPRLQLCYTDTGGTFTDTFLVDEKGGFVLGKASTTPEDLSVGYFNSIVSAAQEAGITMEELYRQLSVVGYGATTGINTILTRTGARVGLLITKGFEQLLMMARGMQTWTEYSFADKIQPRTHRHVDPLVPFSRIRGVTERIDCLGKEVIPLYEDEVRQGASELLDKDIEALAICMLYSFLNPAHERKAAEIVREVMAQKGKQLPVYLSVDVSPVLRELPRANAVVIEAYTAPKFRRGLSTIADTMAQRGFRGSLQIMQSSGGLASVEEVKVVETIESGPVGGLIGARYIGELYGFENIMTSDVGGTSFDVGMVTFGVITVNREPICARMVLGVPMAEVTSIGAGGGTIARLDPLTGRLLVGPESAGAVPGPVCYDLGGEMPTVTDADLALGYIDPDYFLGGRIKLNKQKAVAAIKEKIADHLGMSVEEAAAGIRQLVDVRMRDALQGMAMARGFDTSEYYLLAFGGAGPTHVAGYSEGLIFKGVLTFPYAAAFSAFGAASADYEHHSTRAANIVVPPNADDGVKVEMGRRMNALWEDLESRAYARMEREGFSRDQVTLRRQAMVRYGRQLDDLIVTSPLARLNSAQDWNALIKAFEEMYEKIYAKASKYPQAGYEILEAGLVAGVPKVKPVLVKFPLSGEKPPAAAVRGTRSCYFGTQWAETGIYDWDRLEAGNRVKGPAIVEALTTTLVVPPGKSFRLDEYRTGWLE